MEQQDLEEQNENVQEKNQGGAAIKEIFSWVLSFALAFALALFLKNYVIINADVPTGSMENTIMTGDRIIGNRLAYIKDTPQRGDIVVFHYPDNEKELYVKRVIGLPGETIEILEGKIYVNGSKTPLVEDYLKEEWIVATGPYYFEVPEESYLVLGDNRNDSRDARYWTNTYVQQEKILGKVILVYWPFQNFGKLE